MPRKYLKKPTALFQKRVYSVVARIPRGKVLSYKDVAERSGYSKAFRAVGNILNRNSDPEIPCHRVIKSSGLVGGYRYGARRKIFLLVKEGVAVKNNRVIN